MDVDEVEGLAAQEAAQAEGGGQVVAGAGGEAEQLDLDAEPANLVDLVANPATTCGAAASGTKLVTTSTRIGR